MMQLWQRFVRDWFTATGKRIYIFYTKSVYLGLTRKRKSVRMNHVDDVVGRQNTKESEVKNYVQFSNKIFI